MPAHHMAAEKRNKHQTFQVFGESGSRNGALQALSPGNGSVDIEMMAKCSGRSGNQTVQDCTYSCRSRLTRSRRAERYDLPRY